MKKNNVILVSAAVLVLAMAGFLWKGARTQPAGDAAPTAGVVAAGNERRILYYRNPMGLPDTSPVPKVDQMGMDYVPVYADEAPAGPTVRIGADKLQKLGVRTEVAAARALTQTLHIVGTLQADESRQSTISPRFEGWITRLMVSTTGAHVRRGDALLEVYSPDLLGAQQDYRIAVQALAALGEADEAARASMAKLVQASLERLRNWGIDDAELAGLRAGEAPRREVVLRAQLEGVIIEKTARAGMRFMAGEALYQIADLSSVWLIGSVFEQDLALVRVGAPVAVTVVAYPGRSFAGKVTFISPVLQAETRTAQVRVELANREGLLKPAMYGSVELAAGSPVPRLAVPESAILDTGTRHMVLVDRGGGEFEPRAVRAGVHADGYTEIIEGLVAGEAVVVNGNFLIDSESNLRAAIGGLAAPAAPAASAATPPHQGH